MCLRQSRLATKAHDVPVGLPALKLPRVDHPAPFGPEEMRAELVILDFGCCLADQLANHLVGSQGERTHVGFVQAPTDPAHRMNLKALGDHRLVVDQAAELHAQNVRERVRECGQENPGVGMRAGEMDGTVKRDDRLSCAGRSRNAGRTIVCALHNPALGRVQEDGPLLPREFERALQLVYVLHQAEAALRVWVGEGVRAGGRLHRPVRRAAGREFQKRFRRLGRQVVGEVEQRVSSTRRTSSSHSWGTP